MNCELKDTERSNKDQELTPISLRSDRGERILLRVYKFPLTKTVDVSGKKSDSSNLVNDKENTVPKVYKTKLRLWEYGPVDLLLFYNIEYTPHYRRIFCPVTLFSKLLSGQSDLI